MQKLFIPILIIMVLMACNKDQDNPIDDNPSDSPNILLIIADDMGLDACPGYDIGSVKPNMPHLENMISTGIRFSNVWSYPTCTPTRSSIITGKYGFRTDVIKVGDELSTNEKSLQQYIAEQTGNQYSHAVIGKWHLSDDPFHPTDMGVGYYAGFLSGAVKSYWDWDYTENGNTTNSTEYTTTKFTDLAIDWTQKQSKPWFLWLAHNAPHTPFHLPPDHMHSQGNLPDDQASIDNNPLPYYMAMLEAMDYEIGRLLASMSDAERDNTLIIFIGDNGTPNQTAQEYHMRRVKGSIYQGGINVPMIVSGKNIDRMNEVQESLINTTDLFSTIAALAGAEVDSYHDSHNFSHLLDDKTGTDREYIYSEKGTSIDQLDVTIRNATHKYILFEDGSEALYDLSDNPMEKPNLLDPNQLPLSAADSVMKVLLIKELEDIYK